MCDVSGKDFLVELKKKILVCLEGESQDSMLKHKNIREYLYKIDLQNAGLTASG